jgi:hypothetical protein
VGLEWGPFSLVSKIGEPRGRNSSGPGLENREYGHRDPLLSPFNVLYPPKLVLTSLTSGCHLAGIVRSRTKAKELLLVQGMIMYHMFQ